jgi:hypothetical protein
MDTRPLVSSLTTLLKELVDGTAPSGGFILNGGDGGLLQSLARLSAADASRSSNGGATVAAHADHLRYGISLMNRWAAGENPFRDADWGESWKISAVSDDEWTVIRERLADEAHRWLSAIAVPREVQDVELNGMIGSIAHLAYHLGAVRQIERDARGPRERASS